MYPSVSISVSQFLNESRSESLSGCRYTELSALAVSNVNSYIYITNGSNVHIFSQSGGHIQTIGPGLYGERKCTCICVHDEFVYLGCVSTSGIGSIEIFTLDGYFITSLRKFQIKNGNFSIKDSLCLHVDEADGELALFLGNPLCGGYVCCITGNQDYFLSFDKPSDIKSDRFVLFVLRSSSKASSIVMVDKFDICTILCTIYPGMGNDIRSRNRTTHCFSPIVFNSIAIHPIREEIYICKLSDGHVHVYNWEGLLVNRVYSDYLIGETANAITTDLYGYLFVLLDSAIVRIDMREPDV